MRLARGLEIPVGTFPGSGADEWRDLRLGAAMIHVLQILRSFQPDGPGRLVLGILRAWEPNSLKASVVAISGEGELAPSFEDAIHRLGGNVRVIGEGGLLSGAMAKRIANFAEQVGATHLHAHLLRPDIAGRRAAKQSGLPYFVTEHGVHAWEEKGKLTRPAIAGWYRATAGAGVTICAISEKVRRDLLRERISPSSITLVPNGIDLDSFHIPAEEERHAARHALGIRSGVDPVLAAVGSLTVRKSPMLALETLAALQRQHFPQACLVFAGRGDLEVALRRRARALVPEDAVVFAGHLESPQSVLHAADMLLHPAADEPFGLAVAEAMACGVPVVARAGSGADVLLPAGRCSTSVEGSDPAAWAASIAAFLQTARSRQAELTSSLRAHAEAQFDISTTAYIYRNLYEKMLLRGEETHQGSSPAKAPSG